MEIWSICKRIQILTFLIGLISAEKDILEFLRPDKRNPPQLNEFLSNVLEHQNDFKWIRDFSQNFNIMDIDSMQQHQQQEQPHGGTKKRRHGTYLSSKYSRQNGHNPKYMTNGEYRHNANNHKKARSSHNYHHYKPHQRYSRHKHTYKRNIPTNDVYPYMYENEDAKSFLEPHRRDIRRPIPRKLRTRLQKLNRMRRHAKKMHENQKKRELEAEILTKSNFGDVPVEGVKFPSLKEGGGPKLKLPDSLDGINVKEYSKDSQGEDHSGDQNKVETNDQDQSLSKRNPKNERNSAAMISNNETMKSIESDATEKGASKIKKRDMKIAIMENGKLVQEFTHNDNGGSYLVDFKNNNAIPNPQDPSESYPLSDKSNPENNQLTDDSEKEYQKHTDETETANSDNTEERQTEPPKPSSNNIKATMNSTPKKKLPSSLNNQETRNHQLKSAQDKVGMVSNENAKTAYHNESAYCSSGIEGKNGVEKVEGIQVNKEKCTEASEKNNNVSLSSNPSTFEPSEFVVKEDQNRKEDYRELLRDMIRKRLVKKITDLGNNNDELLVNDEVKDFLRQNPQYTLAERPDGTGNHLLLVPYGNYPMYSDIQDPNPPYAYGPNFVNEVYPSNYLYRNDPYLQRNIETGNNIRVVSNPKYNGNRENLIPKVSGDVPIKSVEQYEDLSRENPSREYPNKYTVKSYVINNENNNKDDNPGARAIKIISREPHDEDLLKQDNSSADQMMTTEYLLFPLKTLLDKKLGKQKFIIPPASEQQPPSQQQSPNGTDMINTAIKKFTQNEQSLIDKLDVGRRYDDVQKLNRLMSRAEDDLKEEKRNILLSSEDFEEVTTENSKYKEEKNFRDLLMDIARSKRYRHLRESYPRVEEKSIVRKKRSYPSFDVDDYDLGMDDNLAKRTETEYTEEQDPYIDNKTKQYNKKKRTNNSLANPSVIEDNGDSSSWFSKFNQLNPITKRKVIIDNNVKPPRFDKSKLDNNKLKNFEKVDIEFLRLKNKLGPNNNIITKPTRNNKFNWKFNSKTKNEYKRTDNNPRRNQKTVNSPPAFKNHFPERVVSSTETNDEKLLQIAATKDYEIEGLLNGKFEKYYKFYKSMEKHLNNRPYAPNFDVYESLENYDGDPFSQYNEQQGFEMSQLYPYFQERALRSYPQIYRNRQQQYFDLDGYNLMHSLQRSKRDSSNITEDNSTTANINIRQKRELEEDFSQYDNISNQEESPEEADNNNLDTRDYEKINNKLLPSELDRTLNLYNAYYNDPKFLEQFAHHRQKSKKAHPKTDEREKSDNRKSKPDHLFPERNSNDAPLRMELEDLGLPVNSNLNQAYRQRLFKRSNPADVHKDVRRQDFGEMYKIHPWMKMERLEKEQNERRDLEKRDENEAVRDQICSKATDEPPEIKMDTCHRGSTPHPILSFRTEDPKLANILTAKPSTPSTVTETTGTGPPNEGAMIGLEDVENGRLAADIVSGVFAEVANCPNLQKFSKGLSAKNSKNLNKIQFETPKASEDKEDSAEQQHLLESVRNVLGKLVNNQIQRRMCQHLPAELRRYLNVITSIQTNPSDVEQKQKQRDSSNTLENQQMAYLYNIPKEKPAAGEGKTEAGQAVEEKAGVMKQLLDKYNSLDPECKAKAAPVKEYIDKHLQSCNSIMQATNKDNGAMEGSKQSGANAGEESTNTEPATEAQSLAPPPESPGGSAHQQPISGENNQIAGDDTGANQSGEGGEGGEGAEEEPGLDRNRQEDEGEADSLIEKELESVGLGRKAKTWRPKFSLDKMLKQQIGGAGERGGEAEEPAEPGAEKEGTDGEEEGEEMGNEENGNEGENEEEGSEENMESQNANILRSKRNFGNLYKRDTDKDLNHMRESMKFRKLADAVEKLKRSEMKELESLKGLKRDTSSEDRYSSIKSKNKEIQDLGDSEEDFQEPLAYS